MTTNYWDRILTAGKKIEHYFDTERYTDADGIVWIGSGNAPDEVWITESVSDGVLTKDQMVRKMCRELLDQEYQA